MSGDRKPFPGTADDWDRLLKLYHYALSGLDVDVLSSFPAQEIVDPTPTLHERWIRCHAPVFGDRLCALKWKRVWWQISEFGLPYAPFESGQWSDIADIGRTNAEALGLIAARDEVKSFSIPAPTDLFLPPERPKRPKGNIGFSPGWR